MDLHQLVRRLEDNRDLVDILIQTEDFLDSLDLYSFPSWIDGEIIDGPYIKKYWISFTLKYPHAKMPDPKGGMRLVKHGAKVVYKKAKEQVPVSTDTSTLDRAVNQQPKMKLRKIWLIDITIPRRFIQTLTVDHEDLYQEVDPNHISAAQDEGIDHETGYKPELLNPEEIPTEDIFK